MKNIKSLAQKKCVLKPYAIKVIMMMSLCYLLLPQILFELFAMKTYLAIVVVFFSLVVIVMTWRYIPLVKHNIEIPLYVLAVSLVIITGVFIISGMGAIAGAQSGDYNRSNAILSDLVKYKWPVVYEEQNNISVMNYYIAYYIPGALVGKLFFGSFRIAELVTLGWSVIGMYLSILLFYILTEVCKLRTLCVLLIWGGLDCVGFTIVNGSLFYGTQHLEHWASIQRDYGNGHIANYMSTASNINWNPQHLIPALILVGFIMIIVKQRSYKLSVLVTAVILFWSPLVAVGVVPFAIALLIYEKGDIKKFISIPDILGLFVVALPMFLYYLSMNLSDVGGRESIIRGPKWFFDNWTILFLFITLEFGLVGWILYQSIKKDDVLGKTLCAASVIWMVVCLFVDYGMCHDFSMRATVVSWYVLYTFAPTVLDSGSKNKRYLILYLIGSFMTSFTEYARMLDCVGTYGFSCQRSEVENNTISGWALQYQYVGLPDSFFFNKLCDIKFDVDKYRDELNNKGQYIIYDNNQWIVYAYHDRFYFYNRAGEETNVSVEYDNETNLQSENSKKFNYGTLSEIIGLSYIDVSNINFTNINILLADRHGQEKISLNKTEYLKIMRTTYDNQIQTVDLSDENWENGVSKNRTILLFPFNLENYEKIELSNYIVSNGRKYKIVKTEVYDSWIYVYVDVSATDCEYPNKLLLE